VDISAQPPRFGGEKDGMMGIGPLPGSMSAMVISPDFRHLYLFHDNKIYQFELPGLVFVKSVEVEKAGRPKQRGSRRENFIKDLATDNDGRVSSEEFAGPSNLFKRWDLNNDGFIDLDEAPR
jgi:hypothetical protein